MQYKVSFDSLLYVSSQGEVQIPLQTVKNWCMKRYIHLRLGLLNWNLTNKMRNNVRKIQYQCLLLWNTRKVNNKTILKTLNLTTTKGKSSVLYKSWVSVPLPVTVKPCKYNRQTLHISSTPIALLWTVFQEESEILHENKVTLTLTMCHTHFHIKVFALHVSPILTLNLASQHTIFLGTFTFYFKLVGNCRQSMSSKTATAFLPTHTHTYTRMVGLNWGCP